MDLVALARATLILQCISGLLRNESRDCMPEFARLQMLCLAVWFLRYTRHFFGPSGYSLRIAVWDRAPPNECSANHMAEKKKTIFVSLSCGGFSSGFSCCFRVKYHYDSTYIFDILMKVVRAFKLCCSLVWETFRFRFFALSVVFGMLCQRPPISIDYYKAFSLTKSPLFGAACIDQTSSCLEGAEQAPLRVFTKQWSPAGQYYRKASYELYSAIMLSV